MKLITVLMICFSLNASASHHEEMQKKWDSMSYEDAKKMSLEKIEKMQAALDEHKSCVNAAKDKEGLKACREKAKAKRKEWKEKMKGKKDKKKK